MKKRKAMQLVKALRSGKYSQGKNYLVDDNDNFCCLGVACNISRADLTWEFYKDRWFMDNRYGSLPPRIRKEFGFYGYEGGRRDFKPIIIGNKEYESLVDANDQGCTFDQIADYIEQHYKAL